MAATIKDLNLTLGAYDQVDQVAHASRETPRERLQRQRDEAAKRLWAGPLFAAMLRGTSKRTGKGRTGA